MARHLLAKAAANVERETPVSGVLWPAGGTVAAARRLLAQAPTKVAAVAKSRRPCQAFSGLLLGRRRRTVEPNEKKWTKLLLH